MRQDIYRFRPMAADDLPLVRRWLETAHVSEWWGDPPEQFTLVSGDLDHPAMVQYIVVANERPFAYLQCYDQTAWPENGLGLHPAVHRRSRHGRLRAWLRFHSRVHRRASGGWHAPHHHRSRPGQCARG